MPRKKGDGKGKTGGRKAGTPNKVTASMRERISALLEERWEDLKQAIDDIPDPKDKAKMLIDLMQYAVPKLASVEYKDKDKPMTLKNELDELSGEKTRDK